jgi:sulfur carrier protein ThiS
LLIAGQQTAKFAVFLKKKGVVVGIGGLQEVKALLDQFDPEDPVVVEANDEIVREWAKDKSRASEIIADKLAALHIAGMIEEKEEPLSRFKTVTERVVYLLAKYPEIRGASREEQVNRYRAIWSTTSKAGFSSETVRRSFAYVQNTLGLYPADQTTQMWRVWNKTQFREFFSAMNADEFKEYAEKAVRISEEGFKALIEQSLGSDLWAIVDTTVNDSGVVAVYKKRYLTNDEFARINNALRKLGMRYDRDLGGWYGGGNFERRVTV